MPRDVIYLSSPNTQQQAEHLADMPALLSFAHCSDWIHRGYQQSFRRVLIDSGAFSEFNSGKAIDPSEYKDFSGEWRGRADAIAGLDDIRGDWKKSLKNYESIPWSFPTFHETDPIELLDDLIAMARERDCWLGFGLLPPRKGKEKFVRSICERIPRDIILHGWAMLEYLYVERIDTSDSTNWWRDAMKLRTLHDTKHLHYGECLEIVVKRYRRWNRSIKTEVTDGQIEFFESRN